MKTIKEIILLAAVAAVLGLASCLGTVVVDDDHPHHRDHERYEHHDEHEHHEHDEHEHHEQH